MTNKTKTIIATVSLTCAIALFFQNCAPVKMTPVDQSSTDLGSENDPYGNDPYGSEDPFGNDPYGGTGNSPVVNHKFTFTPDRKVDIILVVDNSESMKNDYPKMVAGLSNFVGDLQNLNVDWQMCAITTDMSRKNANNNGQALKWNGLDKRVFTIADAKARTPAMVADIFNKTLNQYLPIQDAGDERGIAALSKNVDLRTTNGCYRQGSIVAPIIVSDEDERSWGGIRAVYDEEVAFAIANDVPAEDMPDIRNLPLLSDDLPENYIKKMTDLGVKKLVVNSIVVNNSACKTQQEEQAVPITVDGKEIMATFKAYIGSIYISLSQKTGIQPKSICAANYSSDLLDFANQIEASTFDFTLRCVPKAGTFNIEASGLSQPRDYTARLTGNTVTVTSASAVAFDFTVKYSCP